MSKFKFRCIGSVVFMYSLSSHAAVLTNLNDDNIDNYLTINNKSLTSPDNKYKFILSKQVTLVNGLVKNKYIQSYKGIPIFNSLLNSSEISGRQMDWYGQILTEIDEDIGDITPALDKKAVINRTKKQFNLLNNNSIQNESATLFVRMNKENKAELVYLVSFNVETPRAQRPYSIINAHTGKVISSWDGLTTRNAEGPGGNEKIGSYYYGRDFGSLEVSEACEMSTANVDTFDMKNQTTGAGTLFKFNCPVNDYKKINGAYSPLNDAHFFGNTVFAMYKEWFSMSPLATKFKIRVHYGNNFENAFWDGKQMTFGDGGTHLYPLTSLDVMAHEVSHGVTEKNSGLVYKGQSGGINEAFSDMAGETVEYYANSKVGKENDWLVGASIMKGSMTSALRYFKNPTMDNASIDNVSNYNDSLDVHHTSGIFNKAFYTLATKPNWDIKKAFTIFLSANQLYWAKEATFNSAACGVAKAAADLKYEVDDVIASFKVVGVDANCHMPDPGTENEVEIKNGTVINNLKIQQADEHRYLINVPRVPIYPYSYDLLSIRVTNASGTARNNVELYVRYENGSTTKLNRIAGNSDEMFNINKPSAGNYHILIKGKNADTVSLQAFYGNYNR